MSCELMFYIGRMTTGARTAIFLDSTANRKTFCAPDFI
nr:MAG TPA: hypothetical protein [Caudoviricetes sp.]